VLDIQSGYHTGKVTVELSNQRTDLGEFAIYIRGIRMSISLSCLLFSISIYVYIYKHFLAYPDIQSGYHTGKVTVELSNQRTDLGAPTKHILGICMSRSLSIYIYIYMYTCISIFLHTPTSSQATTWAK